MFAVEKFSGQRPGEEMSVFFACRRAANDSHALSENLEQRSARLQRGKNAVKGQVPGKGSKAAQAAGRKKYKDRWEPYSPSQRVYDLFCNKWDLCEIFGFCRGLWTSVDEPCQFEALSAEHQAYLRFGYISSGPMTTTPPTLILPAPMVIAKTLGNKDFVLAQNDQLFRSKVFLAQMRDSSHPDMIATDLFDFHSETGTLHQV
ncbi:hypothetical protein B0H14DRAFT_2638799 [Mycena olivaceomarginata]|nr:hypothetical protein B0H14DRAFT_2638799 [Mycena olivaceomarginata]